jgi:hypothetical protein
MIPSSLSVAIPLVLRFQPVRVLALAHHSLGTRLSPYFLIQPQTQTLTMRSTLLLAGAAAFASTALAADCAAQNIVDACVTGYQARIDACNKKGNDWICLCDVYTDVLTCYNNCPDSNERSPVQNQVTSYCTAAEP